METHGAEPSLAAACSKVASAARRITLSIGSCAILLLSQLPPAAAQTAAPAAQATGRLIVLGFDGADANVVERMMDAGEMPTCSRLRARGTFAGLRTTMPAESPVSWAALNCGQNPAKTGVMGFVKRDFDAQSGLPTPAPGHAIHGARPVGSLHLTGLLGLLAARGPVANAAAACAASFLAFLFGFVFLLKIRRRVALALAFVLGLVGGFGAWHLTGYVPREIGDVVGNPLEAQSFFEVAARAGVPCVVIDAAMEWDRPDVPNLKLLAGLGVPDVRANNGDWFVYTTRDDEFSRAPEGRATSTGGRVFRIDEENGRLESFVYGPQNFWLIDRARRGIAEVDRELSSVDSAAAKELLTARKSELEGVLDRLEGRVEFARSQAGRVALPLSIERKGERTEVSIGGQSQSLRAGEWSRWYRLSFELNPLVKVKAITRCKLVSAADPCELYVDFLQIDPADPVFWQPISRPASFAKELARATGVPYETVGWACMTMPLKDKEIDPAAFLEDIEFTQETRAKLLEAAFARGDWRVLVDVESTPDRVQHMLYQYADEGHPAHDAAQAARTVRYFGRDVALRDAIAETYRALDRFVGAVVEKHLRPDDTLILCADHGFRSFRRQVHLNNWLASEGYLALAPGITREDRSYLGFVDWSRTRAYALGLGGIYVNQRGREKAGIVDAQDVPALLSEISAKLARLRDPGLDQPAVHAVYEMSKIHSGAYLDREPDLMAGFEAGYRVSWGTTTGGIALAADAGGSAVEPGPVFEDNRSPWSGDHVSVAADLVPGIFFCNRKVVIPEGGLNLLHIAPTALALVGVAVPPECDLPPLEFAP